MRPIVFVSCGQFTDSEKKLGEQVCDLVREFDFEPFYAETQSSLNGLHQNILTKLNKCSGFVAIMHPRGMVRYGGKTGHTRGSVWIEQEIAIAAFASYCLGRKIEIAAFIHKEIKREGLRDLLHLNPHLFHKDDEVLLKLGQILENWNLRTLAKQSAQLEITNRTGEWVANGRKYTTVFAISNTGIDPIEKFRLEILYPSNLTPTPLHANTEIAARGTWTHRFFRITETSASELREPIYPGDTKNVCEFKYVLTRELGSQQNLQQEVSATLIVGDEILTEDKSVFDLISKSEG
jgi:hypothetical protein